MLSLQYPRFNYFVHGTFGFCLHLFVPRLVRSTNWYIFYRFFAINLRPYGHCAKQRAFQHGPDNS
jgi:hypothetical protein